MTTSRNVSHPSYHLNPTLSTLQYRTFDRIYLLKTKKEGHPLLKILDTCQKCLYQQSISFEELGLQPLNTTTHIPSGKNSFTLQQSSSQFVIRTALKALHQKQLLPPEHALAVPKPPSLEACQQTALEAIQHYKPLIIAEPREIEQFTCPITHEVFQEPVVDNHGHTFEKSAIEAHRKNSSLCPLSREPITSLAPNLVVRQTIESYQKQEPIPNFSLFKKENFKLAAQYLQTAQTNIEENEYQEALDSYTKAFQYTQDWRHYTPLPPLFKQLGQTSKAILAYLYLAHYQLHNGKILEALQTLETCQKETGLPRHVDLLLIQLYELNNQPEKALELSKRIAHDLASEHPEQAIALYRKILAQNPQQLQLYEPLSKLLSSSQEKAHLLLQGACHALEAQDYPTAQTLCDQASKHSNTSFIDDLLSLEILEQPDLQQKLTLLAKAYEQNNLPHQALRAYKRLFQLEAKPEYCEKIIAAYQALKKSEPQTVWYTRWLSLLMEKQEWPAAERVAQTALEKSSEINQIPLYETLETIYTHWQGHKLEDLWTKLGQAQLNHGQFQAAEKTYRKAYERFHRFEHAIALADLLNQQGNISHSVQVYYEASALALIDGQLERLDLCVRQIKEIDPSMQHIKMPERMQLLTQKTLLELSQQLQQSNEKQERLAQELQETREEVRLLKENIALKDREKTEKVEKKRQIELEAQRIQSEQQKFIASCAFGAAKWNHYFGVVGDEPPLPSTIHQILSSPCPFWPQKKVHETHLLVLVPQTVNGKPLTLKSLGELVKTPRQGNPTQYQSFQLGEYTDPPAPASHWVLMTRDVIEGSRNKSYAEQERLVTEHVQKSGMLYQVPNILDAAACILMEYVQTGKRLYTDERCTYTRCQEKWGEIWQLVVGRFSSAGVNVVAGHGGAHENEGVSCSRRF